MNMAYGSPRPTGDIDFMSVTPRSLSNQLLLLAGVGSILSRKHRLYLHSVFTNLPDDYETRISPLFPGQLEYIRLFSLEAHDLALAKLERNDARDRQDVSYLAHARLIDPETLQQRYRQEMRPYLG